MRTLSHHNILNNGYFNGVTMGLSERDRVCIPVPLYHCFGMVMGNLMSTAFGATMVYPSEAFDPLEVLRSVEAESAAPCSTASPPCSSPSSITPEFARFDLSSLRTGTMAGSPCPIEVMRRVIGEMHMEEVTIAYGMTETSPVSFQSATDDPIERRGLPPSAASTPMSRSRSSTRTARWCRAARPASFSPAAIRSCAAIGTTRKKPRRAIDDAGWMHTGDQATIDAEGYCNIVGRIKDMVIRGGENVLSARDRGVPVPPPPRSRTVQVIGVPDERYGEELCAWIKLRDGEDANADEIKAFCKDQIAHFKVPRYVRFVDEFPMTVTGKIQKFKMRETTIAELNLAEQKTA